MGMAESIIYYTADMVRDLIQEDRPSPRYETVYGELLATPAPAGWHQVVVGNLYFALRVYLEREPGVDGIALMAPGDISWGRRDVLVQPDVFVVPRPASLKQMRWSEVPGFLLAAEVVSPSSRRADHFTKRHLYQAQGTPLYWMIDPAQEAAEAWAPDDVGPRVETEQLVWHPAGAGAPFHLPLAELFRAR